MRIKIINKYAHLCKLVENKSCYALKLLGRYLWAWPRQTSYKQTNRQTNYRPYAPIVIGEQADRLNTAKGQEAPIMFGVPSPSETVRLAGLDCSACGLSPLKLFSLRPRWA